MRLVDARAGGAPAASPAAGRRRRDANPWRMALAYAAGAGRCDGAERLLDGTAARPRRGRLRQVSAGLELAVDQLGRPAVRCRRGAARRVPGGVTTRASRRCSWSRAPTLRPPSETACPRRRGRPGGRSTPTAVRGAGRRPRGAGGRGRRPVPRHAGGGRRSGVPTVRRARAWTVRCWAAGCSTTTASPRTGRPVDGTGFRVFLPGTFRWATAGSRSARCSSRHALGGRRSRCASAFRGR